MKLTPPLIRTIAFTSFTLMLSSCASTRKADDDDYDDFGREKRSFGERVGDWWDRSKEREDAKFDRMFDRATR